MEWEPTWNLKAGDRVSVRLQGYGWTVRIRKVESGTIDYEDGDILPGKVAVTKSGLTFDLMTGRLLDFAGSGWRINPGRCYLVGAPYAPGERLVNPWSPGER